MRIVNPTAKRGEDIAYRFLIKKGYKILERNFRKGYGELDIIAIKLNTIVFVEVKTRKSNQFGSPLESITPWKIRMLVKTAEFYKQIHRGLPDAMRIDAVAVILTYDDQVESIEHIENISDSF